MSDEDLLIVCEEFIDWSAAPLWAKYAAMDKNGDWYWHHQRPKPGLSAWNTKHTCNQIDGVPSVGDWRHNIIERD